MVEQHKRVERHTGRVVITVCFDLDGVILDSQAAIVASYRDVGVVPPSDILAHEGDPWLERMVGAEHAVVVKRLKDHHYARRILYHEVPIINNGWNLACAHSASGHAVHLLTGAAYSAVDALYIRMHPVWPFISVTAKASRARKRLMLTYLAPCVYYDDQPFDSPHPDVEVRRWPR